MWPDRVSNSGPLVLESDVLPAAPRGPVPWMGFKRNSDSGFNVRTPERKSVN